MGRQEGIDYLLRAACHIVHDLGRTTSISGWWAAARRSRRCGPSRELGVADYVTFTGRVPDDEMLAMLNTADVCVNPDVANEMNDKSTMNKIMEYMALGKPIVQFDLTEGVLGAAGLALRERTTLSTWRRRSSSCWTIRRDALRWANTGAGAWRTNWSGATRRPSCSPPTTRSRLPPRASPVAPRRRNPMTLALAAACSGRA